VVLGLLNMMLMWFKARKITNKYLDFRDLNDYAQVITELSQDKEVPKFATHLVFLTKANSPENVERKILDSILRRRPKRADVYWFLHVNWTDEPYTMEYRIKELVDDKVIRVDFNLGFRVQPRINMLFKQVLQEMVECDQLEFRSKYESLRKRDFAADIRYVLMERFLSVENELSVADDILLDTYFFIKRFALSDQTAFGLDHTDTVVEYVPLVLSEPEVLPLKRLGGPPFPPSGDEASGAL
jgi:KUP system potassium uptake protein